MTLPRRRLWIPMIALAGVASLGRAASARESDAAGLGEGDLTACKEIALRASMLMDANDTEGLVALFTPDLEFVRPATYPAVAIRGRPALRDAIVARGPDFVSRHLFTNSLADPLSDGTVRVRSYFTHFSGQRSPGGEPIPMDHALRSLGEYDDTLVRTLEGWRISRRVARFVFGGL
jgi:hypothetical protein